MTQYATQQDPQLSSHPASVTTTMTPTDVDVVVIGGGFSGLQAARDVHAAGFQTVLLEAKPRIGGRSHSIPLSSGKGIVELGATWINKTTQPKIYELTQKYGLECADQYTDGDMVFQTADGGIFRFLNGTLPEVVHHLFYSSQ